MEILADAPKILASKCAYMHVVFPPSLFLYLRSAVEAYLDMKKVPQERYNHPRGSVLPFKGHWIMIWIDYNPLKL